MKNRITPWRIKTWAFTSEDNYNAGERMTIIDLNIFFPYHAKRQFYNFRYDFSSTYYFVSNGKVNTRLQYPRKSDGSKPRSTIYVKLNFWQKQKLKILSRSSWFHTNPVATWALIISITLGIINIFILVRNSITIPRHYKILIDDRETAIHEQKKIILHLEEEILQLKRSIKAHEDSVLSE